MAGSIIVTSSDVGGGYTKYSVAWTSDASGNVSSNTFDVRFGQLQQVKFIPNSGGTQPTNLYAVTLLDANGTDLLLGNGANLSNSVISLIGPYPPFFEAQTVTPTVSAAGNAKGGTIILYIGP